MVSREVLSNFLNPNRH